MNRLIELKIKHLIDNETIRLSKEEKELTTLPNGSLIIKKRDDKFYFYNRVSNKDRGITRDSNSVYALARKSYLAASIKQHKTNIKYLNRCLSGITSHSTVPSHRDCHPLLKSATYSTSQLDWINSMSSHNQYKSENLIYKTSAGIYVRSKSERVIADKLSHHNLIFKYEAPLAIGDKTFFPDFTILKEDGTSVIWEHNGLMENEDYAFRAFQKIRKYKDAGFYQHVNLICTEEHHILDANAIDEIIFKYFNA